MEAGVILCCSKMSGSKATMPDQVTLIYADGRAQTLKKIEKNILSK